MSDVQTPPSREDRVRDSFLADVAAHELTVVRDDGVYRHLIFRSPATWVNWFELVTWPGCLTIGGDMDGYVFRRLEDMFAFFRSTAAGKISASYWGEKVVSGRHGLTEYSEDLFRQIVRETAEDNEEEHPGLVEMVQECLLDDLDVSSEDCARMAVRDFRHGKFEFTDSWEWDLKDWDWHFLRACHAIRWGIERYDAQLSTLQHGQASAS